MSPTIEELLPLSETLNSESNELNKTIETINDKLAALNFGIEVWMKGGENCYFGYAKVGIGAGPATWELAYQLEHGVDASPLLRASRDQRIEGLRLVPRIVAELKSQAETRIRIMREAKSLAAEL
jgi:hypothetical protein